MVNKLLPDIEDSHEEVAAPAWTAVTEAAELKRELYPSEEKRATIGGHVDLETKARFDQWLTTHDTVASHVIRTFVHLLLTNEFVEGLVLTHLPEKDELAEILKEYTPAQRAELAARLRGK